MKCTACGNDNQPGAKFCVHCGVVLMAAPAAAFSPASSSAPMPQSSTATEQRPVAPTPAAAMQTGTRAVTPPPAGVTSSSGAAAAAALSESMLSPGAAPASRNIGLAVVAVAVLAVIGVGGYFGYRLFAGEGAKQATAAAESSKAMATPGTSTEPPKDAATSSSQEPSTSTVATAPPSSVSVESAATSPATATPTPSTTTPGKPGEVGKAPSGIPRTSAPKAPPQPQPVPAIPPPTAPVQAAPPPKAPPAKVPTVVAQAPVAAGADRWQALADEMARCRKEDLFSRFVCEQRTRAHYCEGYWGKVPQCPSAPPVDHGQ